MPHAVKKQRATHLFFNGVWHLQFPLVAFTTVSKRKDQTVLRTVWRFTFAYRRIDHPLRGLTPQKPNSGMKIGTGWETSCYALVPTTVPIFGYRSVVVEEKVLW